MTDFPRYDPVQTYAWNYTHAPDSVEIEVPAVAGDWTFCGLPVDSPLGMPAGPLLNGRWILYYASLGFDVLTYKTVRSVERACYPLPNLVPVVTGQLEGGERELPVGPTGAPSWAVSFGMPSAVPDVWRRDVEETRNRLPHGKLLSVSVVASMQEGWSIEDLANDYAQCAKWAIDSGADVVETNFSCPNVSTCDGMLYRDPAAAGVVAATVRDRIGPAPYVIKIGHVTEAGEIDALLDTVAPHATSLAMTNSVATTIIDDSGSELFDGELRGICGQATRDASLEQTRLFAERIKARSLSTRLIGVGGVSTAEDVAAQLESGAEAVHIATAAMQDPLVGVRIREELAKTRWG